MVAAVEHMAHCHNFVKFDSGTPWHGESNAVTDERELYDVNAFMERAGFIRDGQDVEYYKDPTMSVELAQKALDFVRRFPDEPVPELRSDTNIFAIKRNVDSKVVGSCAKVWQPYQPRQAFEWFQPWLDNQSLAFNTAGSLLGGSKMWILAQIVKDSIADVVNNDAVCQFVFLANPFDGKSSISVGLTDIRILCSNTLQMAFNSKFSKVLKVKHSGKTEQTMEDLQSALDIAKQEFSVNMEKYRELAKHGVSADSLRKYVRIIKETMSAPVSLEKAKAIVDETPWSKVKTRSRNQILQIEGLMQDPKQSTAKGTWWAAYNSVNTFLNHEYGRSADKRVSSLWFGKNATVNKYALDLALDMAA